MQNPSLPPSMDIKLLVVDIDGTIAGHDNTVSEAVQTAIKQVQAQGIQVAVATGRMYRSALRFHQQIASQLPIIAYQGAWIQDPISQHRHRHLPVERQMVEEVLDYLEQPDLLSLLSVHFYINDELYVRQITKDTEMYAERSGIKPIAVGDLRQVMEIEPTKILALTPDPKITDYLLKSLRDRYHPSQLYLTKSVSTFFEAAHPQVNKGGAVRYLAEEILQLRPENVMAIGDNFNDVEMIAYAGIGVAMGDAPPEVQQRADWVAPSVEEDGVAIAIEKFLLLN
ncbi:Cof-type HAD-IIB family hydrolase [Calothrix sp. NIES-3974]|uniref:Cof-type HAD-IIB family hydrolase n=1 Tax=Calothrix sp. NIES-3974 TaxID=2005462 RepID=UPI000B608C71|nr:Cof-type HAD-IIB family hydrolase [Calothrix sp. NIES-3974]BAZ04749.1 Cof-like hydrolase [Calothrix sp. NIES-3974]